MSAPLLPAHLKAHPRLGQWLDVASDGRVHAYSGKVELGQGLLHTLSLIVAQELQLPPERIVMVGANTTRSPDEAVTSGSLSVQDSGTALRHAAAYLREACRGRLGERLGLPAREVTLRDGVFYGPQAHQSASYADLVDAPMLVSLIELTALPTPAATLGEAPRPDIAAKVFGQFEYIYDISLPGMVFGQVFRPKTLSASLIEHQAPTLQADLAAIDGVLNVLRDGVLIGVLASSVQALAQAAKKVSAEPLWVEAAQVPDVNALSAWLKSQPFETSLVFEQRTNPLTNTPAQTFHAEYERPYLHHASIGLCCALAQWRDTRLEVWSHSQGIFNLRRDLALAFQVEPHHVTVSHREAAGCYGHNGADDVAFDAAWLARQTGGKPVRVQWSRQDEMAASPLGPAMAVAIEAGLDAAGNLQSWKQEVWSQGHGTRPGRAATPALLGAWQTAEPFPITLSTNAAMAVGGGSERNAQPPYSIPDITVLNHRVLAMPMRVSALRSLGAHANVFAAESMMDELAQSQGRDPLAYRLAHLQDARAQAVLKEVARMATWGEPDLEEKVEGLGRGLAFARYKNTGAYCAVVAEVVVQQAVQLKRLYIAADIGLVIHPDGARNQIEGGAIQAASWTLCEAARFDATGVSSVDWESYPIFKFSDVPEVAVSLIAPPASPAMGAGECATGPTAAAIANAVSNALGVRVRAMPLSAERLMQLVQAG